MKHSMKFGKRPKRRVDCICFPDKLANARGFGFIEIEFCYVGPVEIHRRLPAPIVLDHFCAVAHPWHSGPDSPHGSEDPRFLCGRQARWSGDGAELRNRLATPLDHDDAAFGSLTYQFRGVDVKLADGRGSHICYI